MIDFERKWLGKDDDRSSKVVRMIKPETDLRKKIEKTSRTIELQSMKLDNILEILKKKDRRYFNKVIASVKGYDKDRAAVYANELVEIRKSIRRIGQAKLALEQISLRMDTIKDMGDIVAILSPAIPVIKSIKGDITSAMPKADKEFEALSEVLSSILVEAGQMSGITLDFSVSNSEAEKILKVAEAEVEREIFAMLPSVPSSEREAIPI